jgi:thioredoxin reductase
VTARQEGPVFDLAIIGAGPAGMAAAVLAGELGLAVVVLDEQPAPGGQIYRNIERAGDAAALGASYLRGAALARAFRVAAHDYRPGASVWHVETAAGQPCRLWLLRDGRVGQVHARRVLLAAGATERPVPVPGWTLPGVMTVGALQILLKAAGMTPEGPVVLVGNGPLLYLTAVQLAAAGGQVAAVLLTGARRCATCRASSPAGHGARAFRFCAISGPPACASSAMSPRSRLRERTAPVGCVTGRMAARRARSWPTLSPSTKA